jgi:hypothetical protein
MAQKPGYYICQEIVMDPSFSPPDPPLIRWGPFWRALIGPLFFWIVMVSGAVLTNYPGVVCVTPMAWLLALWCGVNYVRLSGGLPDRYPLLGPAAIGALLGLGQGLIFILVIGRAMPASTPDDISKTLLLTVVMVAGGILACAAISAFAAWLRLHRFPGVW